MIVEAIRADLFPGLPERIYTKRSGYQCSICGRPFEIIIAEEYPGEYQELADPVPPHLDLLAEAIDADHKTDHANTVIQTDGVRFWNPHGRQRGA